MVLWDTSGSEFSRFNPGLCLKQARTTIAGTAKYGTRHNEKTQLVWCCQLHTHEAIQRHDATGNDETGDDETGDGETGDGGRALMTSTMEE